MGAETSWFDILIPRLHLENLQYMAQAALGRQWKWQLFQETHFTLTGVLGVCLVLLFVLFGGLAYSRAVSAGGDDAIVPPPKFDLRNLVEMFTEAVLSVSSGIMGEKNARRFLPLIGTLAFFIFFSNCLALIPGFIPPTAMLNTNLALAGTVFVLTHVFGLMEHGPKYLKHFIGPVWWLAPLLLVIELVSHFARPISLSVRLLGNMFGDHKVVSAFFLLIPLFLPVPFLVLGVLVIIIQTLVFCLLTMVYIQGAVAHEEH